MNKHHSYKNIIEGKLAQLPPANADLLWDDMHAILDKEMPQKKERRRFLAWFLSGKGLFLLTFSSLFITSSSLFLLSTKENIAVAAEKTPGSQQLNKLIKIDTTNVLQANQTNSDTTNKSNQLINESVCPETSSISSAVDAITNKSITRQTKAQAHIESTNKQFIQQPSTPFNTRENSEIGLADLNPIHQDFHIIPNPKKEKLSLIHPLVTANKMHRIRKKERGFYAGIMFGADLSSIHFQAAKPGVTTGFVFGYALNQKWSLESGVLWDTKRVYDDGTYFNPPGYTPANGVTIVAVNGKSRLIEWPVNIKYTIKSGEHNFFATSGLSSYFMRLENYAYEYTQNNQPGGHNYLSYKKETKDWFGVASFSVGYSHKLGTNGSIRVEPYLKVPISYIGVANMPIMSTGLNIGITKPLRR
ncbi:MAG TPA: hypothetical protein VF144_18555 [Chitinophagaceae bacterium]